MSDNLFANLSLADIHQDLTRNIASLRSSENLFDDLSESPTDQDVAMAHEITSKPPLYTHEQPIINRPFEEAIYIAAIEFPFKHWTASRYSDGSLGVWYGTDTLETSIHETVFHWRNGLLKDAGWQDVTGVVGERKVFQVRCDAALVDLRPHVRRFPSLVDPGSDYTLTQQVGGRLHREGHPGLVSHSTRWSGDIYAVLTPRVLANPRTQCYLTYRIESERVVVERAPGERLMTI